MAARQKTDLRHSQLGHCRPIADFGDTDWDVCKPVVIVGCRERPLSSLVRSVYSRTDRHARVSEGSEGHENWRPLLATSDQISAVEKGWAALGAGELDKLASFYSEEMIFVLPGQDDVLEGRAAFRSALDGIGAALPPGFDIKEMRYCGGENEVVNIIRFTADKIPDGSHCAVVFRFGDDGKIVEERWFVDTEQWKAAF